jgi:hypothetical protein
VAAFTDFVFRDDDLVAWSLALTIAVFVALGEISVFFGMKPMRVAINRQGEDD